MNRDDLCGGPSLTPPGYYDLPEADEEQCHQCEKWVEVEKLVGGYCRKCWDTQGEDADRQDADYRRSHVSEDEP